MPRPSLLLFVPCLLLALWVSLSPRVEQYHQLAAARIQHGATAPAASFDSYYWFRLARAQRQGVDFDAIDRLRHFPDGVRYEPLPAISRTIAAAADALGSDVYRAGLLLSVLLSSLFVLPMALYGWRVGHPIAGLVGAALGSTSAAYFARTWVKRVDTDGGNLFFVWLIALTMAVFQGAESRRGRYAAAAAAGLAVNGFCLWYAQPGFSLVYLGTFVLIVLAMRCGWREATALVAVFLLCSNPLTLADGVGSLRAFAVDYLFASRSDGSGAGAMVLVFPDVTLEIEELQRYGFWRTLRGTLASPLLALLGLAGLASFVAVAWRRVLPLLPIIAVSVLGFVWASRMTMYAAPLVGFGLGYLVSVSVRAAAGWLASAAPTRADRTTAEAAGYLVACGLVFGIVAPLDLDRRSFRSGVDQALVGQLERLRPRLPEGAAIASSWSIGYAITDLTGAATFDDGRDPNDVVQQLLSRGWTSGDPKELADILGYLARFGRAGLDEAIASSSTFPALMAKLADAVAGPGPPSPPVYALFTDRMLRKEFDAFYYKGQWSFERGRGSRRDFDFARCVKRSETLFACQSPRAGEFELDLASGLMDGRPFMRRIIRMKEGRVFWERAYAPEAAMTFQSLETPGRDSFTGLLMDESVHRSNFNQMFVLARPDARYFELVYDGFPVLRTFALRVP
jgi:undecaprenyl-diphosphooligosaccharide--protein glycosyltransferase